MKLVMALLQLILQGTAFILACQIHRILPKNILWRMLSVAFALMALRRATALYLTVFNGETPHAFAVIDQIVLPLSISVLIVTGLWWFKSSIKKLL